MREDPCGVLMATSTVDMVDRVRRMLITSAWLLTQRTVAFGKAPNNWVFKEVELYHWTIL
jgi:hypothetical protein